MAGSDFVVAAGGPSVSLSAVRKVGLMRATGACRVIAVNDAVYPFWFADHLHASDKRWWIAHGGVPGFAGAKTSMEHTPFEDVSAMRNTGISGFDPDPTALRTGNNSGYQATHLAAHLGAKRIVLLGVDYTDDGARDHWFGRHPPGMDFRSDTQEWRDLFHGLVEALRDRGIEVLNAGSHCTMKWLKRFDLDQAHDFLR